MLALTRQNLPQLRLGHDEKNRCAAGAYEIVPAERDAQVSLFASGSEVAIAVEARKFLRERGVMARVVSVPCFELFVALPEAERDEIIGTAPVTGRHRGRGPPGLGRHHRLRRRLRRHDRLRRQRAVQGTLPAFRHHARSGREAALAKLGKN